MRQTNSDISRGINSKKPWLHVAIPCEIWTKLHSLPFTRISPKTTRRKIALVAIHSDKPKNHSAAPRGFWAYPREWQLVQFCASWFLGLSSWMATRAIFSKKPSDPFQISKKTSAAPRSFLRFEMGPRVFFPKFPRSSIFPGFFPIKLIQIY